VRLLKRVAADLLDDVLLVLLVAVVLVFLIAVRFGVAPGFDLGGFGGVFVRRAGLAFAYGTDPDAEAGSTSVVTSLSPAYTYSLFYTQPITRDLKAFAGIQYVYRLSSLGGELYQQLTPTVGLAWKF